ncbi:hypothetical protein ACIA03_07615 [Nocardioides sp. NPDC051685]|uniref:hypothetical protein n=1 Tax=Nocardioides sp. NPDC051685 TaxID=3364334 RepID=UPI0037A1D33E
MTATLATTHLAGVHVIRDIRDEADAPRLLVVLVSPSSALRQCDAAVDNMVLAGAVTVTCEVDVTEDMVTFAVADVLRTVDATAADYPGLPIVIVGHAEAAAVASMAADACGNDVSGLVITHRRPQQDPASQAA